MVYFRKKSLPTDYEQLDVFLDGIRLTQDESAEFLGISIEGTLNWEKQCTKVANKFQEEMAY